MSAELIVRTHLMEREYITYTLQGGTNCFTPSGGGPDPNECTIIADALLYDSQNIGE